jgi:hypothetical protein
MIIGKGLQGGGRGLTEVLPQHLPGGTEEKPQNLQSGQLETRSRIEPRTSRIQVKSGTLTLTLPVARIRVFKILGEIM